METASKLHWRPQGLETTKEKGQFPSPAIPPPTHTHTHFREQKAYSEKAALVSTGQRGFRRTTLDPFCPCLIGEPRDISDYLGVLGVHAHQQERPDWRGCSISGQLLGARLRPRARTQSRAESTGKVAGRGEGKT